MRTFDVDIGGKTYEVDAPDERTAWAWANQTHQAERGRRKRLADEYAGQDVSQMGSFMRGVGGAKARFDEAAMGLKKIFTDLTPEDQALLERGKAFKQEGGTAATVGGIGSDIVMSAPVAFRAAQGANAVFQGARALPRALGVAGTELAVGTGYGAATAPEDRVQGAKEGAIGTLIGQGVNRAVGGLVRPLVSPEAQGLMRAGVQPTVGQSIGGVANRVEQQAMSLPIVGDLIRNSRNRALGEFNEAAIRTVAPGTRGYGDDVLTGVRDSLGQQYDNILGSLPAINVNTQQITQAARAAASNPALGLKPDAQQRVMDLVAANITDNGAQVTGQVAKRIESDFRKLVSGFRSSTTQEDKAIGQALNDVYQQWRNSLTGAANAVGGQGAALRQNDAAYRAFIPIDNAASRAGSQAADVPGRFTPRALRRAIEQQDTSQFNNATRAQINQGTPSDRLNVLARQGEQVLGDTVPDSGTAGRLALGLATGGGSYAAGFTPELVGASLGTAAAYSRPGAMLLTQGVEPAYRAAVQTLQLRGVPMQQIDRLIRQGGPQAVIAAARGVKLNQGE